MRSAWPKLKPILGGGCDLQVGPQTSYWRQIGNPRRLTILFWVYLAQAVAGSVIGFIAPFLHYFGFL
jgi:hypothetical protein